MNRSGFWLILGAVLLILGTGGALYGFILKDGVWGELQPVMDSALDAVRQVWASHNLGAPVLTSIQDGEHEAGSLHYKGLAFDVRLNDITTVSHDVLKSEVAMLAGPAFDVVHEYHGQARDHLHVEYDPV
jgi:hypothetical protein